MFASQVMNASIVAMFGCIIPEPNAVVTISLSNVSVTTHVLYLYQFNIDFAKSSALPLITSFEKPFSRIFIGIISPMTPVEATPTYSF